VALVKQIPAFEAMGMGEDGRMQRRGLPLEMSAYCRRAVAQAVAFAQSSGGRCTVITLGPPSAIEVVREAIAFGADDGVLLTDPAFAGSDTLATARALAAAIERLGPVDVVFVGRASVDADTGQVGPQLAELLDLAFVSPVRQFGPLRPDAADVADSGGEAIEVGLEHDDVWVDARVSLPAVVACAERLIDPCKLKDPALWAQVPPEAIQIWSAAQLGLGPWGEAGSVTRVGAIREEISTRRGHRCTGAPSQQAAEAVALLDDVGVLDDLGPRASSDVHHDAVVQSTTRTLSIERGVAVLIDPRHPRVVRELLGAAAAMAAPRDAAVVAIGPVPLVATPAELWRWGADVVREVVATTGEALAAEDVARAATSWARHARPWAMLAPGTAWGREVASRVAAALGAGLIGDAVELEVDADDTLVAWKPAFGGALVAAVTATTPVQLVTVRPGVLPLHQPRERMETDTPVAVERSSLVPRRRVVELSRRVVDDLDALSVATAVIGVGQGVDPGEYRLLDPLRAVLGAELAATRKVTDQGWLPQGRQVGITGLSLAPRLYVAIGTSGKFNHLVGVRGAGVIVAIDRNADAPVFDGADIGLVGDWHELVPALAAELERAIARR
jgi:electron transfer flavoprotein alpha subunit